MKDRILLEIANEMSLLGYSLRKEELTDEERAEKTAKLAELNAAYNKELKRSLRLYNKVGVYTKHKGGK